MKPEDVRELVSDRYGRIAESGDCSFAPKPAAQSCCGGGEEAGIDEMARRMGYTSEDVETVGDGANLGLGCGNPQAIAALRPGEVVVDLGSGAGFDCFLAARQIGENGRVIGVDMTPAMLRRARDNAAKLALTNVEFRLGEIEHLPIADGTVDVIISNCVINLSPDKPAVVAEAFRVLKPGGRFAVSDTVMIQKLPDELLASKDLLSACAAGAATVRDLTQWLDATGFTDVRITLKADGRDLIREWAPGLGIEDYIGSAYIQATKPLRSH